MEFDEGHRSLVRTRKNWLEVETLHSAIYGTIEYWLHVYDFGLINPATIKWVILVLHGCFIVRVFVNAWTLYMFIVMLRCGRRAWSSCCIGQGVFFQETNMERQLWYKVKCEIPRSVSVTVHWWKSSGMAVDCWLFFVLWHVTELQHLLQTV